MSSQEKTLLRVILTEGDIRKVTLAKKPDSVDNLVLPTFPDGHNDDSLELVRKEIQDEMKMRTLSSSLLAQKMDLTFALRRKEIVESTPAISDVLERWPALFREPQ
ncbi:hypothetical protein M9458_055260, partial [Cirrhinus mrigala]